MKTISQLAAVNFNIKNLFPGKLFLCFDLTQGNRKTRIIRAEKGERHPSHSNAGESTELFGLFARELRKECGLDIWNVLADGYDSIGGGCITHAKRGVVKIEGESGLYGAEKNRLATTKLFSTQFPGVTVSTNRSHDSS